MNKLKEYTNGGFELNKPDYSIANIYFVLTCGGCPEQYDCYITDRGKKYEVGYVRLRWGHLRCDFPDVGGETIFDYSFADNLKGGFDNEKERVQYLTLISMSIWDKLLEIGALMTKQLKPMLASQVDDLNQITYPVCASPKYDGIRCLIINGVALSRSLKPIPNLYIQQWVKDNAEVLNGLDGEFIVGSPTAEDVFRKTTSFAMSIDKQGEFDFYVFDYLNDESAFDRMNRLKYKYADLPGNVHIVPQILITTAEELDKFRNKLVGDGYEGAMVKKPSGKYKYGRSSVKEGLLLKLKLFSDSEFKIVGFEPKYHNTNEATTNELGRTARSTAKDGMVALDTLGSLLLEAPGGSTFGCGTGFDDKLRKELWEQRDSLIGKLAKVKYFEVGMQGDIPRFPVYLGMRSELDM